MKYILTNIAPNNKVGFGNQIFSLAHSLSWAIDNKINIVFYKQFLNEINKNSYSNISDIIDFELTNIFLEKYNIQIADINKFNFKVIGMKYQVNDSYIDVSHKTYDFMVNGIFHIKSSYLFSDSNISKLLLTYSLNNKLNTLEYNIINGHLQNDIIINFTNIQLYTFTVFCTTDIFYDVRTNLVFNNIFRNNTLSFIINNNINTKKNINCIHLRLEDDAINSWSKQNNLNIYEFKTIIEQKYISNITEKIKKDDLTIILSSDYNNNVIKFLKENKYNFMITPKLSQYRDIAAIYDYHIAELCNNIFIGVFESSYTYLILYRIKNHIRHFFEICYTSDPN